MFSSAGTRCLMDQTARPLAIASIRTVARTTAISGVSARRVAQSELSTKAGLTAFRAEKRRAQKASMATRTAISTLPNSRPRFRRHATKGFNVDDF
jgi:hypothetical protein